MAQKAKPEAKVVNGIDVIELGNKAKALQREPKLARFHFKADNRWIRGGHSQTTVREFHGVGERIEHRRPFTLDADEPPVLLGEDAGANPVEHMLNALVACLTGSLAYHAAMEGIELRSVESTVEGDIDIRGFMGLSDEVRRGYRNIRVTFRVDADAPADELEKLARFSPVFDTVSNGTEVELAVEKT